LGVISGLFIVFTVPLVSEWVWSAHLPAKVHVPSIFLSLVFAVFVGVAFGLYPAIRAARLDPIEALRHE
jgi:putative ABC transport system permease protein